MTSSRGEGLEKVAEDDVQRREPRIPDKVIGERSFMIISIVWDYAYLLFRSR